MRESVESVKSALKRARAGLQHRGPTADDRDPPPAPGSPSEDAIVARFVRAWESADLDALVALLTDDVFMSMPPMPFEYEGRDVVARFCASIFCAGRRFDLVPTRANGQPAFGAYLRAPNGISHGIGLYVLTLTGDQICAMTRFENSVLQSFGLPRSLPSPSTASLADQDRRIGATGISEAVGVTPGSGRGPYVDAASLFGMARGLPAST